MSFRVKDHYDLRKHLHIDHNMILYEERKSSFVECNSELTFITTWENTCTLTITWYFMKTEKFMCWISFRVKDHYDLKKHLHVDHNMISYEERKSSCDECHSKSKTTTTWENTCTFTIKWFLMRSEKVHVLNVIQSWRPPQLENTLARWP